jgi:DNA-binding beta-propeller fold protein YncE
MERCAMMKWVALWLLGCATLAAQQAPIPSADELSGEPFAIKKTWVIGGVGDWDYLTMDPTARQLFIAHGPTVQVVDVETGTVAGTVGGFREAHAVALDAAGEFGYVSDGPAAVVRVFDRRTYQVVGTIPINTSPRALSLEPQTGLLFVIGGALASTPPPETPGQRPGSPRTRPNANGRQPVNPPGDAAFSAPCGMIWGDRPTAFPESLIAVIDPEKRTQIAEIRLCGVLGFAQADGRGSVYVNITSLNETARLDASAILGLVRSRAENGDASKPVSRAGEATRETARDTPMQVDWRNYTRYGSPARTSVLPQLQLFGLGPECKEPRGVAVDGKGRRLFAACNNMKMTVLNTNTGEVITTLTIGPGADAIAYDASHGLIFTANGGGYGSVTIVRQHITDTYAVIQNLPTMQQARTMAIDPSTGNVYLVTTLYGAKLDHPPMNGLGTLKMNPVDGSFQVLVIGN